MRAYIKEIVAKQVSKLFHEPDAETVLSWWIANEGRRPVVVVGAGFTRNAVVTATGMPVTSEHVPLWADISRRFAEDLRIEDASGIDALTLAELHRDGLGDRRFYDLLRDMLKDDELSPGRAHEALFKFDVEAIVTTNFLDTLLDRAPRRCSPIFEDIDVARGPRRTQVLYLHGHRTCPSTWVLSRSQYEDLPTTRPVLLARVRQLLSQHPVLTVGFSLTDPDFHQVYRQLSLDMKSKHPMGLALLGPSSDAERRSEQESAQRLHWMKLGMRIARFKDWNDLGDKFADFFGTLNRITTDQLKDHMPHGRPFSSRMEFARSAIEDPDVAKYVETYRGWENDIWRHCIDLEFDRREHDYVKEKIQEYTDAQFGGRAAGQAEIRVSIDVGGPTKTEDKKPKFKTTCFEERVHKRWKLAWLADEWLTTRKTTAELFADWLYYRVQHEFWEQHHWRADDADVDIAELLAVVWLTIDQRADETGGKPHRKRAISQLRAAHRLLVNYDTDERAARVKSDIEALGGSPEKMNEEPRGAALMEAAFRHMMNGDYSAAADAYDKAFTETQRTEDPLLPWLAAWGRSRAYRSFINSTDHYNKTTNEERRLAKEHSRTEKELIQDTAVDQWMEEARRRITELQKETIKQLQNNTRDRKYERRGMSFSPTLHFAWRTFRDLENKFAPPGLQEQYLTPLLDHGFNNPPEELRYRLRFGIPKTQDWLRDVLESREKSVTEHRKRDRELVQIWRDAWRNDPTKATLVACIEALNPMLKVLDADDVDLPLELLRKADTLGSSVNHHRGWHAIGHELAAAWREYASNCRDTASYKAFRTFAEKTNDRFAADEIARHMNNLPWYPWLILEVATPAEFVTWLCRDVPVDENGERWSWGMAQGIGAAIVRVIANAQEAIEPLSGESWDLVAEWCNAVVRRAREREGDIGSLGPIVEIVTLRRARKGSTGNGESWKDVEQQVRETLFAIWKRAAAQSDKQPDASVAISVAFCLALALMEEGFDETWTNLAEQIWLWIINHWEKVKSHLTYNPLDSAELIWFLSAFIERDLGGRRAEASKRLLELWSVSTSVPRPIYRILDPAYWPGGTWIQLVDKLREGVGGARGEFSASWRIAISSLIRSALLHRTGSLSDDLQFLVEHVLVLVANEEASVANHAAYTAIYYAELCTDTDSRRLDLAASTLEAMAKDVRLLVRQGAAYGAARLRETAKSQRIRDLAERMHGEFEKEMYLLIQTQLRIGAAEAAAKDRRTAAEQPPPAV
ncbi:SIR2 family protein [Sorangium sp. So ce1335]|uniref:SIR2 family protein n=1 Tax=Sorangium sp. So ce1335 TaxID=3133335 RepID=UPI003F5DD440